MRLAVLVSLAIVVVGCKGREEPVPRVTRRPPSDARAPAAAIDPAERNRLLRAAPFDYQLTDKPCPIAMPTSPSDPDVVIFGVADLDRAPASRGDPASGHDVLVIAEARDASMMYGRIYVWDRAAHVFVCAGEVNVRGADLEARALRSRVVALVSSSQVAKPDPAAPPPARTGKRALQTVVGDSYFCARVEDGTVRCAGQNDEGQTGAAAGKLIQPTPVTVPRVRGALELAAGGKHTCARTRDAVWCWGNNFSGELGGGGEHDAGPVRVAGLGAVTQLAAGGSHTCALRKDGKVLCWGNTADALGWIKDKIEDERSTRPEAMAGLLAPVEICAGSAFACARLAAGGVRCWGSYIGSAAVPIDGAEHAASLSCSGASSRVCWVTADHVAACKALTRDTKDLAPIDGVAAIADGWNHTCALMTDATVRCWGDNEFGQLGDGTTTSRDLVPTLVPLQ